MSRTPSTGLTPTIPTTQGWAGPNCLRVAPVLAVDPRNLNTGQNEGIGYSAAYSPTLGKILFVGFDAASQDDLRAANSIVMQESSDGITWSIVRTPFDPGPRYTPPNIYYSQGQATDIIWADTLGLFVVAGHPPGIMLGDGTGTDNTHNIMTSPDGIAWTKQETPPEMWCPAGKLAWSSSRHQILYFGGMYYADGIPVHQSYDGINWTPLNPVTTSGVAVTFGSAAPNTKEVVWSEELLVWFAELYLPGLSRALGQGMVTSPDGQTWTLTPMGGADVKYGYPDCFGIANISNNAKNVLAIPVVGPFGLLLGITWGRPADGYPGTHLTTSPDGVNWTSKATPLDLLDGGMNSAPLCFSPELQMLVMAGRFDMLIYTSTDFGDSWTKRATPWDWYHDWQGPPPPVSIIWIAELHLFMLMGYRYPKPGPPNTVLTSSDGITWTESYNAFDGGGRIYTSTYCNFEGSYVPPTVGVVTPSLLIPSLTTSLYEHP